MTGVARVGLELKLGGNKILNNMNILLFLLKLVLKKGTKETRQISYIKKNTGTIQYSYRTIHKRTCLSVFRTPLGSAQGLLLALLSDHSWPSQKTI